MLPTPDLQRLFAAVRIGDASGVDAALLAACSVAERQDLVADAYSAGHGTLARQLRQGLPQPLLPGQWALWLEWAVRGNQPAEVAQLLQEATPGPAWALGALTQAVRLERSACIEQLLPVVEPEWLMTGPYLQAVAHGDRALMARLHQLSDPKTAKGLASHPKVLRMAIQHGQVDLALEHLAAHGAPDVDAALRASIQGQRMSLIEALIVQAPLEDSLVFDEALAWPTLMHRLVEQKRSGLVGRLRELADSVINRETQTAPEDIHPEAWVALLRGGQSNPYLVSPSSVIRVPGLRQLVMPTLAWAQEVQAGRSNVRHDLEAAADMGHLAAFAFLAELPNMPYDWKDEVFRQAAKSKLGDQVDQRLDDQAIRLWGEETWSAMETLLLSQPKERQARWLGRLHTAYQAYAKREKKPLHPEWLALHRELSLAQRPASSPARPRRRA